LGRYVRVGSVLVGELEEVEQLQADILTEVLATASGNGTLRLWDVGTQQEIGAPITAGSQPVYAVAFNSGGTMLATASADGTARRWDVSFPASLLDAACAIAGQSFTRQQWADYAGSRPYQQVCPAALDPAGRADGDQAGSNEDRGRDA
jgi:WD40 repeat protein